ncbi:MAG: NADPH2:quinone reductase [Paracoccaceae bacterium]|jgi:NADPH2:quinone reductase
MTETMRAVVIDRAGGPEVLEIRDDWPRPEPASGRVLIRVMAFGLNRGEMYTRLGHSPAVAFPRVLGIECAGIVEAAPDTAFEPGQTVIATTGGMGRAYDGGYAEFTSVPAAHVHAVETTLDWPQLAAAPEVFHTAWGALELSLGITAGQTLLIRGGSSAVGLVAADYAKAMGLTVLSTTRDAAKADRLRDFGVDHVLIDDGNIAPEVRAIVPDGVDAMFDLVGTKVIADSFACVRRGGTLCLAGLLGGEWTIDDFAPGAVIPSTTRFTYFSSSSTPMPTAALQDYLDGLADGRYRMPLDRVFRFDEIQAAHACMEANQAVGKIVVSVV